MTRLSVETYLGLRCWEIEGFVGLGAYATSAQGVSGMIKEDPDDFEVWEQIEGGLDARELWEKGGLPASPLLKKALLVLYKRDVETIRAVSELAKKIGVEAPEVSICGVKDRRARAWQFVAVPAERILRLRERGMELHGAAASHVGFVNDLSSRSLIRNNFRVVIRRAEGPLSRLERCLEQLREAGAPNFFGFQRFGLTRPISHLVGSLLARGMYEEAAHIFIGGPSSFESDEVRGLRAAFMDTRDYQLVLDEYPRQLRYERTMARYLAAKPGDYIGAFRSLPLRLRRLLVEAYTSYIFNVALSRSLSDGCPLTEPREGDLIAELDMYGNPAGRILEVTRWSREEAERRIREGSAAIVLPTLGRRVRFPRGPRGDALRSIVEEEGIDVRKPWPPAMHEVGRRGGYRAISIPRLEVSAGVVGDGDVEMHISLVRGSYATSVLREVMKQRCALAYNGVEHAQH